MKELLVISDHRKMNALPIVDILYLEAQGNYTIIHMKSKEQHVSTRYLKSLTAQLSASSFYRIHKSYVVNLKEVRSYEKARGGYVTMSDGKIIPVAQRKKTEFLKRLCAK